jgi:hypothetical protein
MLPTDRAKVVESYKLFALSTRARAVSSTAIITVCATPADGALSPPRRHRLLAQGEIATVGRWLSGQRA